MIMLQFPDFSCMISIFPVLRDLGLNIIFPSYSHGRVDHVVMTLWYSSHDRTDTENKHLKLSRDRNKFNVVKLVIINKRCPSFTQLINLVDAM